MKHRGIMVMERLDFRLTKLSRRFEQNAMSVLHLISQKLVSFLQLSSIPQAFVIVIMIRYLYHL